MICDVRWSYMWSAIGLCVLTVGRNLISSWHRTAACGSGESILLTGVDRSLRAPM